jgi:hypothetical protein
MLLAVPQGLAVKTYQLTHFGGNTYGFMGSDGITYPWSAYNANQGSWWFQAPDGNWHLGPPYQPQVGP